VRGAPGAGVPAGKPVAHGKSVEEGGGIRMRGASEQTSERVAAAGSAMQPGEAERQGESRGGYI